MTTALKASDEATAYLEGLSRSDLKAVAAKTEKMRALIRRAATDVREIGRQLIQVKEILGHGRWGEYLFRSFGWEEQTARNCMNVAVRFANVKSPKFGDFAPSVLYLLAAPSTPQAAVEEALEQAEEGEPPTVKEAKEIVAKHQEAASFEEAAADLPPEKRAKLRQIALKEARRDKLEAIERHGAAMRKIGEGEPDVRDSTLEKLAEVLAEFREALA